MYDELKRELRRTLRMMSVPRCHTLSREAMEHMERVSYPLYHAPMVIDTVVRMGPGRCSLCRTGQELVEACGAYHHDSLIH